MKKRPLQQVTAVESNSKMSLQEYEKLKAMYSGSNSVRANGIETKPDSLIANYSNPNRNHGSNIGYNRITEENKELDISDISHHLDDQRNTNFNFNLTEKSLGGKATFKATFKKQQVKKNEVQIQAEKFYNVFNNQGFLPSAIPVASNVLDDTRHQSGFTQTKLVLNENLFKNKNVLNSKKPFSKASKHNSSQLSVNHANLINANSTTHIHTNNVSEVRPMVKPRNSNISNKGLNSLPATTRIRMKAARSDPYS